MYIASANYGQFGVDVDYLTDSSTFKILIGKFDNEHENYSYICQGDTILIYKIAMQDTSSVMVKVAKMTYSLLDLKKQTKFEK